MEPAEIASININTAYWYLRLLGVYNPKKPDQISGNIQQIFYAFRFHEKHRDYLFFWYENNDFQKTFIQYRMKAHVFGDTPSSALATYGLRKASFF